MRTRSAKESDPKPDVVLLSDDPSRTDEFDAKAHERVASAIAGLIENEPGGRVLGLEGSWGSGKSTIVQLLCDHLQSDQPQSDRHLQTRAVVFDAWAHQGDPLRRTFLEAVIDELSAIGWLPDAKATKFRNQLTGKESTTHTVSKPRLTREGWFTSIAALLVPLGVVLAQNRFHVQDYHRLGLFFGLLFLIAPLLVVVGFWAAKYIGVFTGGPAHKKGIRRYLADLPRFSYFANEQETETTTEVIERGDPTSVEFEGLFSSVLDISLTDSRRLLVVLDNLDRVEEEDAQRVLATMHTFISSCDRGQASWKHRFWTLIPYDPDGLDRLWRPDGSQEGGAALTAPTPTAFVEKIFQVRFAAPPLVLSDWRSYLSKQFEQALPNTAHDEIAHVMRIRALYPGAEPTGPVAAELPTPRQLKQFVNQIGAIRRQRNDIPLVHIAYYVLLRHDRIDVAPRLISGTLPHPGLVYLFAESPEEDLAALHFGATKGLAQQLLLGGALEKALASEDATSVETLKDRLGFNETLESLDLAGRVADGAIELTRAVATLERGGALATPDIATWTNGYLYPVAKRCQSWALSGSSSGVGLAVLLDGLFPGDDPALADPLSHIESEARSADADGHLQLEGAAGLAEELVRRGRAGDSVRICLVVPVERLVGSLAFFGTQTTTRESQAMLDIPNSADELSGLIHQAAIGESSSDARRAFDVLMGRPERVNLGSLGSLSLQWLRDNDPTSAEQLDALLYFVDSARRSGLLDDSLGAAADDGTLMHVVSVANRTGWPEQAGTASMLHLAIRPSFPDPQPAREAPSGTQIVRELLSNPSSSEQIVSSQRIWLIAHSDEAVGRVMGVLGANSAVQPWADHHLSGLSGENVLTVSTDQYRQCWHDFQRALGDSGFSELTIGFLSDSADRQAIISGSDDPTFALAVLGACPPESSENYVSDVQAWASGLVTGAGEGVWQAELQNPDGGPMLRLAIKLAHTSSAPTNPPGLKEALHVHSQALVEGATAWQPDSGVFSELVSLLGASTRKVLASELCAGLEGRDGVVGPSFTKTYGAFLGNEKSFREHEKLPNFVDRLIARDAWDDLSWVVEVAEAHTDTLRPTKRRSEEIENLARTVRDRLASIGDEPPPSLVRLSELLKNVGGSVA